MRRSFVKSIVVALVLALPYCVTEASADVTTFVELGNLSLFPQDNDRRASGPIRTLRNKYQLEAAVLKTREWVQAGKHLDFAVIFGLGLEGYKLDGLDEAGKERIELIAVERLIALQALPVKLLVVLPGPKDFAPGSDLKMERYRSFLATMRSALKDKKIVDLSEGVLQVRKFTVIGLNSGFFPSEVETGPSSEDRTRSQLLEVRRVVNLVQGQGPIILFSYAHDLKKGTATSFTWQVQAAVRDEFLPLVRDSRLIGIFGAPHASADWSIFGTPHSWKDGGANERDIIKAWMTPSLAAADGVSSGLQFVSVSADGKVTATPMALPSVPAHEPRPEHSNKLREGDAHLAVDDYEKAIAAYKEALSSRDAAVAARAGKMLDTALLEATQTEHQHKLSEGDAHFAAEDFDSAIQAYKEALSSRDAAVAAGARKSLDAALLEKNKETFGWRWHIPKWMRNYNLDLVIVGLFLFLLFVWRYPVAKLLLCRKPLKSSWKIKMLTKPTTDVPSDLFLEELLLGVDEIEKLARVFEGRSFARRIAGRGGSLDRFAFTLDLADVLKPGQVSFGGVDIGATARTLQKVFEHFSWRLEIRVGKSGNDPYAYASLLWGPRIERMWRIPNAGDEPAASIREAGRILAYEIFSKGWVQS